MSDAFNHAIIFLINVVFDVYVYILLIRLLLQMRFANYYNPVSQFVIKLTAPIVKPLQKVLPGFKGLDFAIVVPLLILAAVKIALLMWFGFSVFPNISGWALWSVMYLVEQLMDIYFIMLIAYVILSWIQSPAVAPFADVVSVLVGPIVNPLRRIIPTIANIDFFTLCRFDRG